MVKVKPTKITNSLYSDRNISFKCFVTIYKFFHLFFGLDFGFVEFQFLGEKLRKLLTFIQCVFICALTFILCFILHKKLFVASWHQIFIFQYVFYVLILIFMKREAKMCNLIQDLRTIDIGLKVNHASYNLEVKLIIFILVCFSFRFLMTLSLCLYFQSCSRLNRNDLHSSFFIFVLMAIDIVRASYAFVFYAISCRLCKLGLLLKTEKSGFMSGQCLYRSIVDIAEEHKEAYDSMLIAALLFNVPQAMATMWLMVQEFRRSAAFTLGFSVECWTIIQTLMLTILPAICAGMLNTQANKIKVILYDLLLQEEDEAQLNEIERFISYVKTRGCEFRVGKVIPLDADLLGMVLSFCVTYLIVIIQFTN